MTIQNPAVVRQQLQSVRETQAKVAKRIKDIQGKLQEIEKSIPEPDRYEPEGGVCMSGNLRIWCVNYVKVPRPNLRDELLRDLVGLQARARELRLREINLARRVQMRRQADNRSKEFDKQLEEALTKAERVLFLEAELDGEELAALLEESEKVLTNYVNLLRANPSVENINAVLKHLTTPVTLGSDAMQGKAGEALRELDRAAKVLLKRAQDEFEKVPSVGNFDRVLSRTQMSIQFGGEAWTTPPGFRSVNKTHTVVSGDSLSGMAKHYYGKASYWPYIYMENFRKMDPKKLMVGMTISIP